VRGHLAARASFQSGERNDARSYKDLPDPTDMLLYLRNSKVRYVYGHGYWVGKEKGQAGPTALPDRFAVATSG
jgi:hypothetical protein